MRPAVVLLDAFPLDSRMWDGHREALEEAGFGVVAPDLPGEPEAAFSAWARRVPRVVDGDFVPVDVSMGGYLAFELWRQAADRIRAIALVHTRAAPDAPEARKAHDELIALAGEAGIEAVWERMRGRLLGPGAPDAVVERARRIALDQPISGAIRRTVGEAGSSPRSRRSATGPTPARSSRPFACRSWSWSARRTS